MTLYDICGHGGGAIGHGVQGPQIFKDPLKNEFVIFEMLIGILILCLIIFYDINVSYNISIY